MTIASDRTIRVLGKCLDAWQSGTTSGTAVDLYHCNGSGAQQWSPGASGSLVNPESGLCLDDTGAATTPGTIWRKGEDTVRSGKILIIPNGPG